MTATVSALETLLRRRDNSMISRAAEDRGLTREQVSDLRALVEMLRVTARGEGAKKILSDERERLAPTLREGHDTYAALATSLLGSTDHGLGELVVSALFNIIEMLTK